MLAQSTSQPDKVPLQMPLTLAFVIDLHDDDDGGDDNVGSDDGAVFPKLQVCCENYHAHIFSFGNSRISTKVKKHPFLAENNVDDQVNASWGRSSSLTRLFAILLRRNSTPPWLLDFFIIISFSALYISVSTGLP